MTTQPSYKEQLSKINKLSFKSEIEKEEYINKLEYYFDPKLKNRLYGKCIEKNNLNYKNPCLEFQGNIKKFYVYGKDYYPHRVSYALSNNIFVDNIPTQNIENEKLVIRHGHNCLKNCIEPSHLTIGTQHSENMHADKIRDETLIRGDKAPNSKISEKTALEIKHSKGEGTQKERSIEFGVSMDIIKDIDLGRSWAHIPDKDGNINNNDKKRKKERDRRKSNKLKIFTDEEWESALKILLSKSNISKCEKENIKTDCHIYQGAQVGGYGVITYKGYQHKVHILSCSAKYKRKASESEVVRHLCDIKLCCNPEHLDFGSNYENAIDALEYSKVTKLKESDVKEIKLLFYNKTTMSVVDIAKKYNVSTKTIYSIRNGKSWKHVTI
jgi:hypothetical protein